MTGNDGNVQWRDGFFSFKKNVIRFVLILVKELRTVVAFISIKKVLNMHLCAYVR